MGFTPKGSWEYDLKGTYEMKCGFPKEMGVEGTHMLTCTHTHTHSRSRYGAFSNFYHVLG